MKYRELKFFKNLFVRYKSFAAVCKTVALSPECHSLMWLKPAKIAI